MGTFELGDRRGLCPLQLSGRTNVTPASAEPLLPTVVALHCGTKYSPSYVWKLKEAVALNLGPHRFVLLTDQPDQWPGIETIAIPGYEPGMTWWAKLALFKPGLIPGKLALFLDLDSAIVGDLTPAVTCLIKPGEVVMVPSTVLGKQPASPAMLWIPDTCSDLWVEYNRRGWRDCKSNWRGGDQRFITNFRRMNGIKEFPLGMFHSYKEGLECKYPRHSHTPVVIVYHGKPKPLDLPVGDKFREMWENPKSYVERPS